MSDRPYSVASLAERWGCSERHIRDLIAVGDLPAFRLGAKHLRIAARDVQAWESGAGATIDVETIGSASSRARAARSGMKADGGTDTGSASRTKSRRDLRLMRSLDGVSS